MYEKDPLSAIEALSAAQWLAFAPLAFQATAAMRDRGVLAALGAAKPTQGCTLEEVVTATKLSTYAVRVLLEAGLGLHIVWRKEGRYHLGKLGRFLLDDEMTKVNFDFTRDVCYQAAAHLGESLSKGRPVGLQEIGPWATLYEGLSVMPEPALSSWHAFDHYHSDQAFPAVADRLALNPPLRLLDVGCNTGKWAQVCLTRLPSLEVGLVDLAPQLARARKRLDAAGVMDRVQCHPMDLLDQKTPLPGGYDLIWMSQFLDCFSDDQIVQILKKARDALGSGGRVWILELFWDRQRFEAAAFSLQQTSLYFSCVANGNSQMYDSEVFLKLVARAGLVVTQLTDGLGGNHTLLECSIAV
ncbi:MAG: class I SAM-dependent methyltransferase [Polaromonas sp.]